MPREVQTATSPLNARLPAAPSKSVTHRALIAAALAEGRSTLRTPLHADDSYRTAEGLRQLGLHVADDQAEWIVEGSSGRVPGGGTLDLNESGTSLRLLCAVAALGERSSTLDGVERLRQRPLRPLGEALQRLGAAVEPIDQPLPWRIGGQPVTGERTSIDVSKSSQFASALMMIGPCLPQGLLLELEGPLVSGPYLEITAAVMRAFGARFKRESELCWRFEPSGYQATDFAVDGDHSSASYLLAAPLIAGGCVRVEGLDPESAQADAWFWRAIERFGGRARVAERAIEIEAQGKIPAFDVTMGHAPDLVPTVAMLAALAEGPCSIRDVAHLRFKESDRLEQLASNLNRLGCPATATDDALQIDGSRAEWRAGRVETAGDHRIAMAFALLGLRVPGIEIDDPDCVGKSFPEFWERWEALLA